VVFAIFFLSVMSHRRPQFLPRGASPNDEDSDEQDTASHRNEGRIWIPKGYHETPEENKYEEDTIQSEGYALESDTYSVAISCLIRDRRWLDVGEGRYVLRYARTCLILLLVSLTMGLQIWLAVNVDTYLCAHTVYDVRDAYDKFEAHMYSGHVTTMASTGERRGVSGHFNTSLFDSLDEDVKDSACRITLTEPQLLAPVLFIWCMTVLADLRTTFGIVFHVVLCTRTLRVGGMKRGLNMKNKFCNFDHEAIVCALTFGLKYIILTLLTIPRVVTNVFLLVIGSRWLTSTTDFQEVIINGCALGFILDLTKILFSVVPDRIQRETQGLMFIPYRETRVFNYATSLGTYSLIFVALLWAVLYMYVLQGVLVDYKWDVSEVCHPYVMDHDIGSTDGQM